VAVSDGDRSVANALRQAAEIGPFFDLTLDPTGPEWTSFADFAADREAVGAAIAQARAKLADRSRTDEARVEPRAAASVWHLGVAARIASPTVGAAVLSGWLPRLDRLLWHSRSDSATLAIRAHELAGSYVADAEAAAEAIHAGPVRAAVEPLTQTVAAVGSVSDHVLWGNVWSAFAGVALEVARVRPEFGDASLAIVRALVETADRPMPGRYLPSGRYRRDTCCLYYRLPRGGLCGDCVLHRMPSARPQST
jgi:hypothetical protein